MRIDLTGRTAMVTGATAGIGFAIARGLLDAGAEVVVNGIADDLVADAVARLVDHDVLLVRAYLRAQRQ